MNQQNAGIGATFEEDMDVDASFETNARNFVDWCAKEVVPLWAASGVDRKNGGFFEQLHFDGTPDVRAMRRLRVSSRQIYAFSHAGVLGWADTKDLVSWGVEYLLHTKNKGDNEPGFAYLLDADGHVCDPRRDLYDHSFHLLALAWASRATNDSQILQLAVDLLAFIDEAMGAKQGGWHEGLTPSQPRRQNPHMHMLEAMLALYEASNDAHYLTRADDIIALLQEYFILPESGVLVENFDLNLTPIAPYRVEPGHVAEWCWLLHRRAKLGKAPVSPMAQNLGQLADGFGAKGEGFLLSAFDEKGNAIVPSRRLWGQTEWLKAITAQRETRTADRHRQAAGLLQRMSKTHFAVSTPGLWVDEFDKDGQALSSHVPASIVYHLVSAAAEVECALAAKANEAA